MEELIFFGVIILFSILDAIAKKKRQQAGEVEAPEPEGWQDPEEGVTPWEPPIPKDPDGDGIPGSPRPEYTRSYGERGASGPGSSEGMVPTDIWEEIGALARGEREPAPDPEPEPWEVSPAPREEPARERLPATSPIRRSQVGQREVGSHPVHRSHAGYGTDPSERPTSLPPRSGGPSREVRAVRAALVEGGPRLARQAVILREVLDKPLAYREDGPGS